VVRANILHGTTVLNVPSPTSARLKRCAIILQEFDHEIVFTKGQLQADVDCFSRAPIDPPDQFIDHRIFHIAMPLNIQDWAATHSDEESLEFLELAKQNQRGFTLVHGFIFFSNKLYVPPPKVPLIIRENHASGVGGHGGTLATTMRLEAHWWPIKTEDIKSAVSSCEVCQAGKVERMKPAGTMH
jgi:hypothetical protein